MKNRVVLWGAQATWQEAEQELDHCVASSSSLPNDGKNRRVQTGSLHEKELFSFFRNVFPPKEHEEPARPCVMGRFQFVMITYELQSTTTSAWEIVS